MSHHKKLSLYNYIKHRSSEFGCIVRAVNGMSEDIHVVISIPPTIAQCHIFDVIAVCEYIRKIKAGSSTFLNKVSTEKFAWQNGYGVFSKVQK